MHLCKKQLTVWLKLDQIYLVGAVAQALKHRPLVRPQIFIQLMEIVEAVEIVGVGDPIKTPAPDLQSIQIYLRASGQGALCI